jgi:hypothetical protein
VNRSLLCARWVLVLVLVFDLASTPLHHHHGDEIDMQPEAAAAHSLLVDSVTHAESDDSAVEAHAAMANRVEPSRAGQLPTVERTAPVVAVNARLRSLAAPEEPIPRHRVDDRMSSDFRSHRSLPPAGRAPPLHA